LEGKEEANDGGDKDRGPDKVELLYSLENTEVVRVVVAVNVEYEEDYGDGNSSNWEAASVSMMTK
jgi:hypothetical protein